MVWLQHTCETMPKDQYILIMPEVLGVDIPIDDNPDQPETSLMMKNDAPTEELKKCPFCGIDVNYSFVKAKMKEKGQWHNAV